MLSASGCAGLVDLQDGGRRVGCCFGGLSFLRGGWGLVGVLGIRSWGRKGAGGRGDGAQKENAPQLRLGGVSLLIQQTSEGLSFAIRLPVGSRVVADLSVVHGPSPPALTARMR